MGCLPSSPRRGISCNCPRGVSSSVSLGHWTGYFDHLGHQLISGELGCNRGDTRMRDPVRNDVQPEFACGTSNTSDVSVG